MNYELPFKPDERVYELGGGAAPKYHPNVDVRGVAGVDIVASLEDRLPIDDGACDGLYSQYAIEHVSWRKVGDVVREAFRILKPGGRAVFITANVEAQMAWAMRQEGDWDEKISQCLFGDHDYSDNAHKVALNPAFAISLFRKAGFTGVFVIPWGELGTDMLIEAVKPSGSDSSRWTTDERKAAYDHAYFNGGGKVGGYAREGYMDFPVHWKTLTHVMARHPESVLELGCARGYVLKRLQDAGITAVGLEISEHCHLTRVCSDILPIDLTVTPWPFTDGRFDLCFSAAVLEHIPESLLEAVASEIRRVSKRGLHGVEFQEHDNGFDKTHCTLHPREWWANKLGEGQEIVDKEDLEKGDAQPPGLSVDEKKANTVKLNIGCFHTMFHHGWTNIDILDVSSFANAHGYIFKKHDVRSGLPYGDRSVELIYASHFLEHLTYDEGLAFLRETRRVLKPDGLMRLAVPDAAELIEGYTADGLGRFHEISPTAARRTTSAGKLWELLFAGHEAIYDLKALQDVLRRAGFARVQWCSFRQSDSRKMQVETIDMLPDLSLFMEARP